MSKTRNISGFSQYRILLGKDLKREIRSKEMLTSMGIYAILVLVVFGIALSQISASFDVVQIAGGLLWALFVFTSLLGLNRSFSVEKENDSLQAVMLVPMDRSIIFLAKSTSNFIFILLVEIVVIPLFVFFFLGNQTLGQQAYLAVVPFLLGTVGIAGIGTLLSTITVHTRGKDVMLAILMVPLIFPLLYACVSAITALFIGAPDCMDIFLSSVVLSLAYDVIMIALAWFLYDLVLTA